MLVSFGEGNGILFEPFPAFVKWAWFQFFSGLLMILRSSIGRWKGRLVSFWDVAGGRRYSVQAGGPIGWI